MPTSDQELCGAALMERLDRLGAISEEPGRLTRTFLSPAQRAASDLVLGSMREAGMTAREDAIGNVIGRYEGERPGLPALVLGSHLDTVRDGGKYDGMLGVVAAIACVADLNRRGVRLPFAIEIYGFGDEEGVRFGATMLGSRAVAGTFGPDLLQRPDDRGITLAQALLAYGLDPADLAGAARRRDEIIAYVELHIEQGPVLERLGLAAGCVSAISGATRLMVTITGVAGHAGTVPMTDRQDALAAAASCILAVEARCDREDGLVGTVGRIEVTPGAINVIPGEAKISIDIRAPDDRQRSRAVADVLAAIGRVGKARRVAIAIETIHEMPAAPCAPWLTAQIDAALGRAGLNPVHLPSGAGHDGMALIGLCDIAMIFVRCAGGISHNPAESITAADAEIGARLLLDFIEHFQPRDPDES